MFWLFFSLFSILFAYLASEDNVLIKDRKIQTLSKILLVITLSYPIGFGGENYIDHEGYVDYYNNVRFQLLSFNDVGFNLFSERTFGMEFGYSLLNKICYTLGFDSIGFLFIIALITNSLFVSFIFRFKYPAFNILVFITSGIYWQECNLIRQMLAVAIFCYSLKFLINGKIVKYISLILCASLIHTSALLLLIFCIFSYIDIEKHYKKIFVSLLIFWFFSIFVSSGLLSFNLSSFGFLDYYSNYLVNTNSVGLNDIRLYSFFYNICLFLFFLFFDKSKFGKYYIYTILFVLGGVFTNFSVAIPNFYRFSLYFSITNVIMLPTFLKQMARPKWNYFSNVSLVALTIYFFSRIVVRIISNDNPITNSLNEIFR